MCITAKRFRNLRFSGSRKSTCLYVSLALVACDKIRLINSTVFACYSVVCPICCSPPITVAKARLIWPCHQLQNRFAVPRKSPRLDLSLTLVPLVSSVRRLVPTIGVIVNCVASFPEYALQLGGVTSVAHSRTDRMIHCKVLMMTGANLINAASANANED